MQGILDSSERINNRTIYNCKTSSHLGIVQIDVVLTPRTHNINSRRADLYSIRLKRR